MSMDKLKDLDMETWLDDQGIDYRVTMGSSGEQINVRECPRCGGSEWKVYMNRDNGLGNCFHGSCVGEPGFNKFSFIKHSLGSSKAAFESIERYLSGLVFRDRPKKLEPVKEDVFDWKLPESKGIPIMGRNLKYLEERGFDASVAEYFRWRYCKKGYFFYKKDGGLKWQDYSKRVVIPIYDLKGNLVTFQGRDITGSAEKKYLFPPGLPGTGRYIYNGHNVKHRKHIVIGEGAMDVAAIKVALDKHGLDNELCAVGSFGKNISTGPDSQLSQLLLLHGQGVSTITFMWDGEYSAIKRACELGLMLSEYGLDCNIALLPKGKDPNEVDASVVISAIQNAQRITRISASKIILNTKRAFSR